MLSLTIPVSNLDSDSVSVSPVVCVTNLALVYLRTILGPQGPKPLPQLYVGEYQTETSLHKEMFMVFKKRH